jgi:DNA-binding NarL/FixJ family response regulator
MTTTAMLDTIDRLEMKPVQGAAPEMTLALVDRRVLYRECLAKSLLATQRAGPVLSFGSVAEWSAASAAAASAGRTAASLVLYCIGARRANEPDVVRDVGLLSRAENAPPAILLSDVEDPDQILLALEGGIRGYFPTSPSLDVGVEALQLVWAGGIFVPASTLIAARRASQAPSHRRSGLFTPRQTAVVESLRRGKANKVIAFELNMCESTVKVHVRNVMRKLKARSRTEVAFLTHEFFSAAE